jgi:hypothetical protein
MPDGDEPNAAVATTHRVAQWQKLFGLDLVGNDSQLHVVLCGGAVDELQ